MADVFEITMNARAKNALGTATMNFLLERLEAAAGKPILLTGTADAFSAGLDLKEVASLDDAGMHAFLTLLERTMCTYYLYPAPIVAHVNGHAIAGGSVLALCCDHAVATSEVKTRIGLNEVALGLRFPPRILHLCRERLPRTSHGIVLLGAGLVDPSRANELGLVDEIAADAGAVARARLEALAAHPADAYAATKRALRGASPQALVSDAIEASWLAECAPIWAGDAVKQRVMAVLKR
jgi:enoyl-CoA hydratase/carnithine racemase